MDLETTAELRAPAEAVFAALADLATYPDWMTIVAAAVPSPTEAGEEGPAWAVDLSARLGPVKRRKRVRVVRTLHDRDQMRVCFERQEQDGRSHSSWVLSGGVGPSSRAPAAEAGAGSRLWIRVEYGGAGWLPGLDLLVRQEARRAGERLDTLLCGP